MKIEAYTERSMRYLLMSKAVVFSLRAYHELMADSITNCGDALKLDSCVNLVCPDIRNSATNVVKINNNFLEYFQLRLT